MPSSSRRTLNLLCSEQASFSFNPVAAAFAAFHEGSDSNSDSESHALLQSFEMATYNSDSKTPEVAGSRVGSDSDPISGTNTGGADGNSSDPATNEAVGVALQQIEARNVKWWSYLTTVDFWIVLCIGQILALCITATNTFSTFLVDWGTSIPAFQTIFNYVVIGVIYTGISWYKMGVKAWFRVAYRYSWRYLILSFLDVEGNYFTVLAYRYTNLLSAQLLNFWAIVCVVIISFFILKVRYRPFQIAGILVCCGGMGILLASDHLQGVNGGEGENMLKGDLFGLLGATCYGISNVFEEFLVSKRPMYEVLSFLGLFGIIINGVQAAIFDRQSFADATWNGAVIGYIAGYTICLSIFYSLAPLILRMGSAAFFDISLLTGNFWGTIIGIHVFGYAIHWMYPIAFVCIVCGLIVYFLAGSMLGDSKKPWLGDNQEGGVAGLGTAKLKALNLARKQQLDAQWA
ncbi:putative solute carrier family 35 member f1 protein [Zalerion maritima]|uniref:Solute carrier family 35 member f1 protein n=1 Tax=Zalerion maritima TaxID=339359 RepID=A0AAD5RZT5_9PEZI|nr:putative solute carrier family 35 member f1 protein [Zalerion maritima]